MSVYSEPYPGYGPLYPEGVNPVASIYPYDPAQSPLLEQARECIARCQAWQPNLLYRNTVDANAYRQCLAGCSGLPADPGAMDNWPAELIRTAGMDIQTVVSGVTGGFNTSLVLIVLVVGLGAYIAFKVA